MTPKWIRFRKAKNREEGQAMVELALVLPILLLILLGIIEFGHIFYSYLVIQNASRDGARYGVVWDSGNNHYVTNPEVVTLVKSKTTVLQKPDTNVAINITPTMESTKATGGKFEVKIVYNVPLFTPFWEKILPNPFPITAKTVMRIE